MIQEVGRDDKLRHWFMLFEYLKEMFTFRGARNL